MSVESGDGSGPNLAECGPDADISERRIVFSNVGGLRGSSGARYVESSPGPPPPVPQPSHPGGWTSFASALSDISAAQAPQGGREVAQLQLLQAQALLQLARDAEAGTARPGGSLGPK